MIITNSTKFNTADLRAIMSKLIKLNGWAQNVKEGKLVVRVQTNHRYSSPIGGMAGRAYLGRIFVKDIGGAYYTPDSWISEANRMGVSRRISAVPKDFVLGETWIAVAHREFWTEGDKKIPAIFHLFKPTAIQYVVKPKDSQKKLKRMIKRGITLVKIERLGENLKLVDVPKPVKRT